MTPPSEDPVLLEETKEHARIDGDDENELVTSFIKTATQELEEQTNRQLVTATYDWFLPKFPPALEPLFLPLAPLASIVSVSYVDTAAVTQTWDASKYVEITEHEPGFLEPARNEFYPETLDQTRKAVTVRFTCGYGAAAAVPDLAKRAIWLLVGHYYKHREETTNVRLLPIPNGVARAIAQLSYGDEFLDYSVRRDA